MTQLWPRAGGRTRAVFLRNQRILSSLGYDVELIVFDRMDDLQERIIEASRRFDANFAIDGIFSKIRFLQSGHSRSTSIGEVVFSFMENFEGLEIVCSSDDRLVTVMRDGEALLTFWSPQGLSEFKYAGSVRQKILHLLGRSKVVVGYRAGKRQFRCVLDMQGKLLSKGLYRGGGSEYIAEEYFNVFGEVVFSSIGRPGERVYRVYVGSEQVFEGINAYQGMVDYLFSLVCPLTREDTLVIDEPSLYRVALNIDAVDASSVLYFHWHNLGEAEQLALQDRSVPKRAVFLTASQRDDFLMRCGVVENEFLETKVIDNVLDVPGALVQRSSGPGFRILSVGRLAPEKNVHRALRIFAHFVKIAPDSIFTIIGDGPSRGHLERYADELGISGNVVFTGDRNDPYDSPESLVVDCALLTPRFEAYGLVYPEMIGRGVPVIALDAPYGPSRWIEDFVNGRLLPYEIGDVEAAQEMLRFLTEQKSPELVSSSLDIGSINTGVDRLLVELFS